MSFPHRRRKTFWGIKGLTEPDSEVIRLPIVGQIRKGAERTQEDVRKKRPGRDLEYFRFTSDDPHVQEAWDQAHGPEPDFFTCYVPHSTVEENFTACKEKWGAGGLQHRCNGEVCYIWQDENGVYHSVAAGAEPIPCPGGCEETGILTVIIPELLKAGVTGYVQLITHSKHDILSINGALRDAYRRASRHPDGDISAILWRVRRKPNDISRLTSEKERKEKGLPPRVRTEKWLIELVPDAEWVRYQLQAAREHALGLDRQLPPGPEQPPDWEDVTSGGRALAEVEAELVEIPGEKNGRKPDRDVWKRVWEAAVKAGWQGSKRALLKMMGLGDSHAELVEAEDGIGEEQLVARAEYAGKMDAEQPPLFGGDADE